MGARPVPGSVTDPSPDGPRPTTPSARPSLVERGAAVATIDGALDALADGRGGRLVVEGPRGTGRTRLLGEAARMAHARGLTVASARAVVLDRELPFGLATRLLRGAIRAAPGDAPEGQALRRLLDEGRPATDAPLLEGGLASIHALARAATEVIDAHGPIVLAVDDAHRSDPLTWRLLSYLGALAPDLPVLVLVAWDTAALEPATVARSVMAAAPHLTLTELGPDGSAALVLARFADASPSFTSTAHVLTGGNPAQLTALLDAAVEADLRPDDGGGSALRSLATTGLVVERLVSEIRASGPNALALARAVAFLDDGAPLRLVAPLAGLDAETAAATADRLVRAAVLREDGGPAFRHPLRAEALREDLGAFTRARWHRRAAMILAADGETERAGAHLLRADPEGDASAVDVLRAAADAAARRGDGETAARLLRRALEEPVPADQRSAVLIGLARVAVARGERAALGLLEDALAATADAGEQAEVLRDMARLHYARGDVATGATLAARARDAVPSTGPAGARMQATWLLCAGMDAATHHEVRRILDERVGVDPDADADAEPEVDALLALHALSMLGSLDGAVRRARRALDRDARRDHDGLHLAHEPGLSALLHAGRFDTLTDAATNALALAERRGSVIDAASAAYWRGLARLQQGDVAEAAGDIELVRRPAELGWHLHTPHAAMLTALVAIAHGDLDAARAALADPEASWTHHPLHRLTVAEVALLAGDATVARRAALDAGTLLTDGWGVVSPAVAPWRSVAARAAVAAGDVDAAVPLAEDEVQLADRSGVPVARARALGALALVRGGEEGIRLLRDAHALVTDGEANVERLRVAVDLGSALRRTGERRASRDVLAPARAEAEERGLIALATRAADEQRASGARPRREATSGVDALTPSEL
ncbi:MAG: AAA family ATPase, partial [Solirubrobacteraceae bacterium]